MTNKRNMDNGNMNNSNMKNKNHTDNRENKLDHVGNKTDAKGKKKDKNMRKRINRKIKIAMLCAALSGTVAAGGIMAYFTDNETVVNTFTVGKVSLSLIEPGWKPPKDITPNQEIIKDPQIVNDGVNKEYVFMEVIVPYRKIIVANQDGTKRPAADTELFQYSLNPGWTEIGVPQKDEAKKTVKHLYVYGTASLCTELQKGKTTAPLFNKVTFVNAVEGQNLETTTQEITVHAYGIQTTDINGGKNAPTDVWQVITNQLLTS